MSIDAILQQFAWSGIRLGLEPSLQLLAALGNPQQRVPIVHVAGSNGKGSVCAYVSTVLTTAGYRVGRYTSPHLVSWCERICLNNQPIAPDALEHLLQRVVAAISPDRPAPTQFEVITAAAWLYFAEQQVDIAVIEVGLGGRLDSTNVCDRPLVSVITSISREHWQVLGNTLGEIASEKAGILKPGCPAVIGQVPAEAAVVINRRIAELGCPAVYPNPAKEDSDGWAIYQAIANSPAELAPSDFRIKYRLPLQGEIQLHNSALAIATLLLLRQAGWQLPDATIAAGIAETAWAGRLQWYDWQGQRILIDGAHNPEGAAALGRFVDRWRRGGGGEGEDRDCREGSPSSPVDWVMGMMAKKEHQEILQALLRAGDRLFLVPVPEAGSAVPEDLAALAQAICPDLASCQVFADEFAALTAALQTRGQGDRPPLRVLCGSLYLIGHFLGQAQRSRIQ